jgi:putative transposase
MRQQQAKSTKQRQRYPTDLTDAQWAIIEAAMPPAVDGRTGGPPLYPRRELWNAIFYQLKNGGTWRALPHDFPPWPAVWQQYRRWRDNGTLAAVHEALRPQVRRAAGKDATPSAAIVDSQSIRVAGKRGMRTGMTAASRSRGASAT